MGTIELPTIIFILALVGVFVLGIIVTRLYYKIPEEIINWIDPLEAQDIHNGEI